MPYKFVNNTYYHTSVSTALFSRFTSLRYRMNAARENAHPHRLTTELNSGLWFEITAWDVKRWSKMPHKKRAAIL